MIDRKNIRITVHPTCSCGHKGKNVTVHNLDSKGIAESRVQARKLYQCPKCIAKDKERVSINSSAFDFAEQIAGSDYHKQKEKWLRDRAEGLTTGNFKPKFITKNGKRIRIR